MQSLKKIHAWAQMKVPLLKKNILKFYNHFLKTLTIIHPNGFIVLK